MAAGKERESMSDDVEAQNEKPRSRPPGVHPAFFIGSWIFFSNLTILLNKWLIDTTGFRYPVILTCWHLIFATLATQFLARTTTLLDGRQTVKMTGRVYLRAIVPIGIFYSASLVCSNLTYLYLSVAFIQMLKAAAPVAVLFVGWAWGVENPTLRRVLNVHVIVLGVVLASVGEVAFSWAGVLYQLAGIIFEAMRLIMVQVLLASEVDGGTNMDPLVSLYYYAPVCAAINFLVAMLTEWWRFDVADVGKAGLPILGLSTVVAFLLNVSSVFVIGKTSGLAMCLTGILKNILLVIASVAIWHTSITALQLIGYGIACFGLVYYSLGWEQVVAQSTVGWAYAKAALWEESSLGDESHRVRKGVTIGLALFIAALVALSFMYNGGGDSNVVRMAARDALSSPMARR